MLVRLLLSDRFQPYLVLFTLYVGAIANPRAAQAQIPTGGTVVQGEATIAAQGNSVVVQQASNRAVIDWNSFSIGQGAVTRFAVPNSSASTLNRVTGNDLSDIQGTLRSNGQVFLINPNGIVFGPQSVVNVGSLVASTLDITNREFSQGGDLRFRGQSQASVTNRGSIRGVSGDVYMIGADVQNRGSIAAPNGTVGLAGGQDVLLVDSGNPRLIVQPTTASVGTVVNSGEISGVDVELAAHGNALALAINNTGTVRATGAIRRGGRILLTAKNGNIESTGDLQAFEAGSSVVANAEGSEEVPFIANSQAQTLILRSSLTGFGQSGNVVANPVTATSPSDASATQISSQAGGGLTRRTNSNGSGTAARTNRPGSTQTLSAIGSTTQRAMIEGRVWEDSNANGAYDSGEKYLNGWKIELLNSDGELEDDKRSRDRKKSTGWYEFLDAKVGSQLRVEKRQGWRQTSPDGNKNHPIVAGRTQYNFGVNRGSPDEPGPS